MLWQVPAGVPPLGKAYEALKRHLADRYSNTREYSEAKGPFIRSILSRI